MLFARICVTSLFAFCAVGLAGAPAHANDIYTCVPAGSNCPDPNGTWKAWGHWDDSLDKLCVRHWAGVDSFTAKVTITPIDYPGDPTFSKTDVGGDNTSSCTGNLSIPEDHLYRMTVTDGRTANSRQFHT